MALTVKIRGDATHFEKTMAKVKAIGASVGSGIASIGKASAIAAAGITAMAVGGGMLALHLAKVAEEGAAAEDRLESITKQMGLFGGQSSKVAERLGELADKTALQTGVDDDAILATQAKLMTFKELAKTAITLGGAFDRATAAAIDMQAAGFGSAEQNAVQLGKALNDPVKGITALARSGITFTQVEKDKVAALVQSNQMLKAQDMILAAIEKQVGGTAAATAKGTQRMNVAISQLTEKIGGPMATALSGFADGFISMMPAITGSFERVEGSIIEKATGIGTGFGKALGAGIAQAIDGDLTLFAKTGAVIGRALVAGVQSTVGGTTTNSVIRPIMEWLEGGNMDTPEAKAKAKATVNSYLGEEMSAGQLMESDMGLTRAIDDLRSEIRVINSGGNIDASKQTLEEMRKIRILVEKGAFSKPASYSR